MRIEGDYHEIGAPAGFPQALQIHHNPSQHQTSKLKHRNNNEMSG